MDAIDITKPLAQLYGTVTGKESPDPNNPLFMPLLLAIEETFTLDRSMTDGAVLAALDRLCQNPNADFPHEPLAGRVQDLLKAVAANNYSRQDFRLAPRKIKQSVTRHNKLGGTRGYLETLKIAVPALREFRQHVRRRQGGRHVEAAGHG